MHYKQKQQLGFRKNQYVFQKSLRTAALVVVMFKCTKEFSKINSKSEIFSKFPK